MSHVNHLALNQKVSEALIKHPLYSEFVQVKNKLQQNGFVCWIAGGAVRDFILDKEVSDFDLVTDATTQQILTIFPEAIQIGISFGVVKLGLKKHNQFFDLATFRRESDYIDGRRPSKVDFATPQEDAGRRDFTINALFWDEEKKHIVDYFEGLKDLENKILKCVGDPSIRFQEDHLRVVRLIRFQAQLQMNYEENTYSEALAAIPLLEKISGERIWAEFIKWMPSIVYIQMSRDDLVKKVLQFLFKNKNDFQPDWILTDINQLDQVHGFSDLKFYFMLTRVFKDFENIHENLKRRFKISNEQIKVFESLQFCIENLAIFDTYEWLYQIEKNELILRNLQFLSEVNLFKQDLFLKFKKQSQAWPPFLVTGSDLLGLIEKEKIGQALKKIRLLQFKQPDLDKSGLIQSLKTK